MPETEEGVPGGPTTPTSTGATGPRIDRRRLVAGVLLLFLSGLGIFQGALQTFGEFDAADNPVRISGVAQTVSGRVEDPQGTPLAGVEVTSLLDENRTAVTDANGTYALDDIPSGYDEIRFSHPSHANTTLRLIVLGAQVADVVLSGAPGDPESLVDHPTLVRQETIQRGLGAVMLGLSAVTVAAAVACYRARPKWLGVLGALSGLVVGVPLSLILAPASLYLVMKGRWPSG